MKNIQQIKTDTMLYAKYQLNHKYVVSEGINYSDVYSINRNDYSCEFEIKTNKADLDSELKHIFFEAPQEFDWYRADNKVQKHYYYRKGLGLIEENSSKWFGGHLPFKYRVPNYYSFVIPESLYAYLAIQLSNTPYGIVTFRTDGDWDYWTMLPRRKAERLHKDKANDGIKVLMLNRAVNEMLQLRRKVFFDGSENEVDIKP